MKKHFKKIAASITLAFTMAAGTHTAGAQEVQATPAIAVADEYWPLTITSLNIAIEDGHTEAALFLIDKMKDLNTAAYKGGRTPLMMAASKDNQQVVAKLLDKGVAMNTQQHVTGMTALMYAAAQGHKETSHLLTESGANPLLKETNGKTAADIARDLGQAFAEIEAQLKKAEDDFAAKQPVVNAKISTTLKR